MTLGIAGPFDELRSEAIRNPRATPDCFVADDPFARFSRVKADKHRKTVFKAPAKT